MVVSQCQFYYGNIFVPKLLQLKETPHIDSLRKLVELNDFLHKRIYNL